MNDFDQFERRLAAALRSDADQGTAGFEPQRIARAAIASAQGPAVRMPRRFSTPTMFTRLAAAAVIGALVVGGAFYLGQRGQPAVVGGPSQTPGVPAATSPAASASGGPTAAPTVGDPCALLTQAEVAAALGESVGTGAPDPGVSHSCAWKHPINVSRADWARIQIDVGSSIATLCVGGSDPRYGRLIFQVSGIGDRACLIAEPLQTLITFEKGGQAYTVTVFKYDSSQTSNILAEQALALDAVARL